MRLALINSIYMQRTLIKDLGRHIGETVLIQSWVDVRRDQGKMVFFDFRDRSGKVQGVWFRASTREQAVRLNPDNPTAHYVRFMVLGLMGDQRRALRDLAAAARLNPFAYFRLFMNVRREWSLLRERAWVTRRARVEEIGRAHV